MWGIFVVVKFSGVLQIKIDSFHNFGNIYENRKVARIGEPSLQA